MLMLLLLVVVLRGVCGLRVCLLVLVPVIACPLTIFLVILLRDVTYDLEYMTPWWLCLLPVLGLPMCISAFRQAGRVKRLAVGQWNPGHRYVRRGLICAGWGMVLLALEAVVTIAMIFSSRP